ncbi:hypothetical protein ACWGJ2_35105 [Streptomyces sp. NPDC054796]
MGAKGDHAEKFKVAEDAMWELREVLKSRGITLPSLELDPVSRAMGLEPLIDLSRCNVATARKLAESLRAAEKG